jgi:hypothetical protein
VTPLKKIDRAYKIKVCGVQKPKSDFEFHRASQLNFQRVSKLPSELLTSTGRYIYVLKIMSSREKCMASLAIIMFKKQSREMYKAETAL